MPQILIAGRFAAVIAAVRAYSARLRETRTRRHGRPRSHRSRQEPFITAYARTKEEIDFGAQRLLLQAHLTWPEPDPGQSLPWAQVAALVEKALI